MVDPRQTWTGKRVTVMGLGTRGGGAGMARYLASHGAIVTVTDLRPEFELASQIAELSDLPIRFVLGAHDDVLFRDTGLVIRNPGVRRNNRYLDIARTAGVPIDMEMSIFLAMCPSPVIGITGTKGKTSTSVMCGEILRNWCPETVVAGNMGVSAVAELDRIDQETPVVLELSSWQLEAMDERHIGPHIAVVTNISEDHLDTYRDFEDYAATKRSIVRHLNASDIAILNADDPFTAQAANETNARILWFGAEAPGSGITVFDDHLTSSVPGHEGTVRIPENSALRGHHQRMNAAAATAAALSLGASIRNVEAGLASFPGVANRMELVAEIDGVLFVNDTAATAPAAAIAGMLAFADRPIHLITGGADKQLDMREMATEMASRAQSITILDGTASPILRELLVRAERDLPESFAMSMREGFDSARRNTRAGDVVLLSPGCASFGLFRDEFDRGGQFRECVNALIAQEVRT